MKKLLSFTIHVSKDDIAAGISCSPGRCPIAIAARRVTGYQNLNVDDISMLDAYECVVMILPPEAQEFIGRFDDLKPVEPFTFTVTTNTP